MSEWHGWLLSLLERCWWGKGVWLIHPISNWRDYIYLYCLLEKCIVLLLPKNTIHIYWLLYVLILHQKYFYLIPHTITLRMSHIWEQMWFRNYTYKHIVFEINICYTEVVYGGVIGGNLEKYTIPRNGCG